jgi:hypothetical protein
MFERYLLKVSCVHVVLAGAYWWVQHFYRCSSRELQRIESLRSVILYIHVVLVDTLKKKVSDIPAPYSPWAGLIKLFSPRECLVSDIPAGDGNVANLCLRPHCIENPIYVFLFWELRGLSSNFRIHVSVIPRIGPHISCSRIGRSFLTDT